MLRHIQQRLPRDGEHPVAPRISKQISLVPGKGLAALVGGLEIDRVADTKCKNLIQRQRLLAQYRPDVAGLLTRQRHQQVERERRMGNRGFNFSVEIFLEPFHIRSIRHGSLPSDRRWQRHCIKVLQLLVAPRVDNWKLMYPGRSIPSSPRKRGSSLRLQ
jgi:hypothetical protein